MCKKAFVCGPPPPLPQVLTETAADVDVEVDAVVAVVHQVAIVHFDQRAEVVLLTVGVERVAGHLHTEEAAGFMVEVMSNIKRRSRTIDMKCHIRSLSGC